MRALAEFLAYQGADDARLVPIALAKDRDLPPRPLDTLKSFPFHDLGDRCNTRLRGK